MESITMTATMPQMTFTTLLCFLLKIIREVYYIL